EARDENPGPERPHVDELAPAHHQGADDEADDRRHVRRAADDGAESVRDPAADRAAVPAEVEDGGEEQAERDEREPHQLVVLAALRRPFALLLDPRGQARTKRALLLPARHGAHLRRGSARSYPRGEYAAQSMPKYVGASYERNSPRHVSPSAPCSISI